MWLSMTKEKTVPVNFNKKGENRKIIVKYPLKNSPKVLLLLLLPPPARVNSSMYQIESQEEQD